MMLVLSLGGCRQILGFESVSPPATDATSDTTSDTVADAIADTPSEPITVTFQQGVNGYAGARDTFIEAGAAGNATASLLRWKADARYTLIAFDLSGTDGVPTGAKVQDARLFVSLNQTNATGNLVEVAVPWQDTVIFEGLGATAGVTAEDLGSVVAVLPTVSGISSMEVTSSITAWVANPSLNQGWIFVANSGGGDSSMRSSEDGVTANRPRLVVTYVP